jgi:hypothetical protein
MRVQPRHVGALLLACIGATSVSAQTPIYGLNVRLGDFFDSNTSTFVSSYNPIVGAGTTAFAIDFDADATVLWGIEYGTQNYGTFDLATGAFTALGVVSGPALSDNISGLTCDVFGVWWLSNISSAGCELYRGDVTTGTFTLVGDIGVDSIIDLSVDSYGNMYAMSIATDSLYSIDTLTGAGTLLGATGLASGYAQGMDFDWSDDTLYATIYTGGGTGKFCDMNLTTGAANVREDTFVLNAEMEMACQETFLVQHAMCQMYCGSDINMNTYTVTSPVVLGGTFAGSVGFTAPNIGAVAAGYIGRLTFPIWGMEGLVDVGTREIMGLPANFGTSPVVLTWAVPSNPAYVGFHVYTQAAGIGGGVINLTCAYDCTAGY